MKAYIIGAGMSGLVTGTELQKRGVEVTIFEKQSSPGGASGSFSWGAFPHLDLGPHIYHTNDAQLVAEWKELFGDIFHEGKFWSKNVKGKQFDEFYDYPMSEQTIRNFPSPLREKVLAELANVSEEKRAKATSFYEYVKELVGPTLLEMFFTGYPQKLWGVSIHAMTANWAPKRIQLTKERMQFHAGQWSAVGKHGSGAILKRIADAFVTAGGKLLCASEVTGIEKRDNLITALTVNNRDRIAVTPDDVIVSTMPINALARKLGIANTLRFRGAKLVFVAVNKPQVIKGEPSFFYYDDPSIVFHRVSEQKKFCSYGFPGDKTVLTVEVAFSEEAQTQWGDKELAERVVADLERAHLTERSAVYDTKVISLPCVYPFLSKEAEPEFARVLSEAQYFKQIYLIGTGGEFHYADLQILYLKGKDLAERLVAQSKEAKELVKQRVATRFNMRVQLGARTVSADNDPFIIAEIGLNHNGSKAVAKELVDRAVEAGCGAVKFQTYKAENRISKKLKANKYSEELIDLEEPLFNMFKRLELSLEDYRELFAYARARGVEVFATPFDIESLALLESLNCNFYKIASMDLVNLPLITAVAKTGKPLIISTGMSSLGQIDDAVGAVRAAGNPNLILLHCVSAYPANPAEMNLNVIRTLESAFHVPVGLSDHSIGLTVATVALAMGARVIERHFTLDRSMEGPDHILSSEPREMAELVRVSRLVRQIQGRGEKVMLESEVETANKFKKCLYAKINIRKGEIITEDKLAIKGPGGGILPKDLHRVVGRVALTDIEEDYPIVWEAI